MNILLLEDDAETASYLAKGLGEFGHRVDVCRDGASAIAAMLGKAFDVAVLDRMVPPPDGLAVLKAVRAAGCDTPTLILTARSRIEDRVEGFEAGADDYLIKPFAFVELIARLNALARRPSPVSDVTTLRAADLEMDLLRRTVRRGGRYIDLQAREFGVLELLLRNAGKVVTRTMLLDRVWNLGFDPRTNIVETHISRLRAKLDEGFETSAIRTIRGAGYAVVDDAV